MVYKRKQKSAPEEVQQQNICLDGVEIKEEAELIIEDTGVFFIGLDDNEQDDLEFCHFSQSELDFSGNERQIAALDVSYEEIIEIDDDGDLDLYDSMPNLNDSGEVGVSNEPIEDSFIVDDTRMDTESTIGDKDGDSQNVDCTNNGYCTEEEPDKDAQEFMDENIAPTRRKKQTNVSSDNGECLSMNAVKYLIFRKYLKMKCHLCEEVFAFSIYPWLRHMRQQHHDFHSKMLSSFSFQSENIAICKICKAKILYKASHMLHYILQHSEVAPKMLMCSVCNYAESSVFDLQEHQKEKHPLEDEEKYEECPKCPEVFKNSISVDYHFQTAHSREFWGKFRYGCHLCVDAPKFDGNKKNYYGHLITEHKLNNWKVLKFRKFDVGRYLQCTECLKIFTNTEDINKLLGHYLSHQVYCFWSCKFCEVTLRFNEWPALHICTAMKEHYGGGKNRNSEVNKNSVQKQISWNEFEICVTHVCPFCKEQFDKFEGWRLHVREIHYIHTLEGLNMSIIPHEPEMLQCLQCFAPVTKSAVELHKHRFQHLPYQPYKCRHCTKSLATYNLALNHVLTRCEDDVKPCTSKVVQSYKLKIETECSSLLDVKVNTLISITCPLCNNKRFSDFEEISKHFRNVHDNFQQNFTKAVKDRKRKCKVCHTEMSKNSISVTIQHYLQHLYDKPFKCKKCQRSFPAFKRAKTHVHKYHFSSLTAAENILKPIKSEKDGDPEKTQKPIKKEKEILESVKTSKIIKKEKEIDLAKSQKSVKREKDVEPAKVHRSIKRESDVNADKAKKSIKREGKKLDNEKVNKSMKGEKRKDEGKIGKTGKKKTEVEPEPRSLLRLENNAKVLKEFEQFITYACPECNESISSLQLWENHIQTQHTFFHPSNLCVFDKKGNPKCNDCNLSIPHIESRQRRHKLSHMAHRSFICSLCLQRFSQIAALYIHMRKTHFAKRKSKCPLCRKILLTAYDRTQHVKQSHSRKEWPDDMCLMCFKTVADMEHHLRVDHHHCVNRPKYNCAVCGISYSRRNDLDQHMTIKHNRRNGNTKDNAKAKGKADAKVDKGSKQSLSGKRKLSNSSLPPERKQHKAKKHCTGIKTK